VLLKLGGDSDLEQAAANAEKLIGLHPQNAMYQTLKARVDFHRHELDKCIETLNTPAEDDLTSPGAERLFLLAMALHERKQDGDSKRARESFEQALKQMQEESPGDVSLIELREEAAAKLGIPDAAEAQTPSPKESKPGGREPPAAKSADPGRSNP
jgi:tetratricopeptide (TPR) repeat protein